MDDMYHIILLSRTSINLPTYLIIEFKEIRMWVIERNIKYLSSYCIEVNIMGQEK